MDRTLVVGVVFIVLILMNLDKSVGLQGRSPGKQQR